MKRRKTFIAILIIASCYNCKAQSCEIFEIPNVKVYLYPVAKGASFSKMNDSISYSLEKILATKFRGQKLLFDKVIGTKNYKYAGKSRYQVFKMRKRNGDKMSTVKEKRRICLLE